MNEQQKQQVVEQIKSANHVLVTVSTNPTVDELAASIGLTLAINKMDKHATTVFSGHVPSTIEFLQPEKTIETTTDSLRDFIIALDKSKADKLRYKVEDDVVRIFITPYRTTITDKDLEFSQGDFNVDLVLAIGVTKKQDLDTAITAHGRILHDATIVALTKREVVSELGSINWQDSQASSLCEMVASIITAIQPEVIDGQMATAFLTGIIAETDRFKNDRTTPLALSLSSQLMSSGANQQLIAEKLDEPEPAPELHVEEQQEQTQQQRADGELEIDHSSDEIDKIHIDDNGNLNLAQLEQEHQNEELPEIQESYEEHAEIEEVHVDPSNNDEQNNNENLDTQEHSAGEYLEQDSAKSLFDDLASKDENDNQDNPTLDQPESSDTPMMQHQRVIDPPVHPGDIQKSDKPFDPQEAMKEAGIIPQNQQPEDQNVETPAPQEPVASEPELPESPQVPQPIITEPLEQPSTKPEENAEPASTGDSLADLEKSIGSPHVKSNDENPIASMPPPDLIAAQESVNQAISAQPPLFPAPDQALGAHPINLDNLESPKVATSDQKDTVIDPNAPPPVPPPMTPQFYDEEGNNSNPFINPKP